jgi:hypothetical protein
MFSVQDHSAMSTPQNGPPEHHPQTLLESLKCIFSPKRDRDYDPGDFIYSWAERPGRVIKSLVQMAIAIWALIELAPQFGWSQHHPSCVQAFCYSIPKASDILTLTGDALAAAAAVELVYTLFTSGPDEAPDPLMLGLSSAALLSLGQVTGFDVKQGAAMILYALALGILFFTRKYLAEIRTSRAPSTKNKATNPQNHQTL